MTPETAAFVVGIEDGVNGRPNAPSAEYGYMEQKHYASGHIEGRRRFFKAVRALARTQQGRDNLRAYIDNAERIEHEGV